MKKKISKIDKTEYPEDLWDLIEHINKVNSGDKKEIKKITDCFIVNSKDLFDKKKNPHFKLSVESILKNNKIKKRGLK